MTRSRIYPKTRPARLHCLPGPEQDEARVSWTNELSQAAPNLRAEADALFARLSPDRWALEWSLPYWLGETLGLPREQWLRLVVSNLFGLGFVRLQDDLVDEESQSPSSPASPSARAPAILLSAVLQQLWMSSLLQAFGAEPRFWLWFRACMRQWQDATWASLLTTGPGYAEFSPADFAGLGHRGAPLKVCVAGACLLAGQPARSSGIAAAVDDLLTGAVLLDQAHDWEEDVVHGRPNVFVSYALGTTPLQPDRSCRRPVNAALLAGDGAGRFFEKTRAYLKSAARKAKQARLLPLAEYACCLEAQAAAMDRDLRRRAREVRSAAGARLALAYGPG